MVYQMSLDPNPMPPPAAVTNAGSHQSKLCPGLSVLQPLVTRWQQCTVHVACITYLR